MGEAGGYATASTAKKRNHGSALREDHEDASLNTQKVVSTSLGHLGFGPSGQIVVIYSEDPSKDLESKFKMV